MIELSSSDSGTIVSCISKMSYDTTKLSSLENTLQQSIRNFREIVKDFEDLCNETEDYKKQLILQKEMCDRKSCNSAEALKKIIESKDLIIQLVASALTKLYETKNLTIVDEAMKIICGDTTPIKLEPCSESTDNNMNLEVKKEVCSLKNDLSDSLQDVSFKEESLSEIEGTPGRTSPIIQSKKLRNGSSDYRDKKKCPDNWPTPQSKSMKLIFTTPSKGKVKGEGKVKLKQGRLNVVTVKKENYVDLTSSPELMTRDSQNDSKPLIQMLVKKESTDNDETILPSPTSGPPKYPSLLKNSSKSSPFKKPPLLSLKSKSENKATIKCEENSPENFGDDDETINSLLLRIPEGFKENSPIKDQSMDYDETNCEIASSLSILQPACNMLSPSKRPLAENQNVVNVPSPVRLALADSSISLLRPPTIGEPADTVKRKIPEFVEPIYKEPAPRKKAEKRALPGWSCDECKNFYDELYKNDPVMLEKKMNECSRHRGRNNPARPKTPDGFWNPRWDVPEDTEEFNRRNNAV